jgi:nucleoside-diphosphate-sugar epimerase
MKILVLGGTGAVGSHLVNLLAEQGNHVVVTSRTRSGQNGKIQYVTGNAIDNFFLKDLLSHQWDAVVDFMVYPTEAFKSRYKQILNSTNHYVYLSSSRVYANCEQPITENSPRLLDTTDDRNYLATDEYALAKARQENSLFDSRHHNWSIVRPYITYSDQRLQLGVLEKEDWLYRALKGKAIVTSKEIQSMHTTLTYGKDVAKGITAIIGQAKALGEAFHITSCKTISWNEVLDTYTTVLDNHLPESPKVILQELNDFFKWRLGKYQIIYDRLYNRQFDNKKINKYIDTSLFTPPKYGITQCLKQFINTKKYQFKPINWRAEAIKDRLLKEKTPLEDISEFKQKIKYFLFKNLPIEHIKRHHNL